MAERHDIDITISNTGEVHLEVKGIKGSRCLDITKDIEDELGIVINREKKSEFYEQVNDTDINITNTK
ncbi:MAG: DUF2997 domain-containing protein [Spirochaetales bacterium]|nr:DUF2997 domain-containing protein [Spirochaetales bacterium]